MAEDLDSFFKKKKTKGKKKYTTSDSIKKAVEDSQKVEEQKKSLPNDEDTQNIDPVHDLATYYFKPTRLCEGFGYKLENLYAMSHMLGRFILFS